MSPVIVQVQDSFNNVVTSDSGRTITLTPSAGTINAGATANTSGGVATFSRITTPNRIIIATLSRAVSVGRLGTKLPHPRTGSSTMSAASCGWAMTPQVPGAAVESPADVIEYQHRGTEGTTLQYTLVRLGTRQAIDVELAPSPHGSSMYFVLAAVGLFTLLVGASVRLRRPDDQATLHFFWLCVAFFGAFTFSFTGPLDRLDWIFYWGDAVAMALVPALLLHFTLEFPERPERARPNLTFIAPLVYAPAVVLGTARIIIVARGSSDGAMFSRAIDLIERGEHIYLFVAAAAALGVLIKAFRQITSETGQRQLRWISISSARLSVPSSSWFP
jgi:hypothetical protein